MKCENGEILRVELDDADRSPIVISLMSAKKCMRKGYEAYLALVLNTQVSELKIESVPVVYEFIDVFYSDYLQ